MAQKTLVDGTAYEISGGRTLVNGTGYTIKSGRTLVDGTGYTIDMSGLPPVGTSLNNMTWEEVRAVSDAGLASSYFAIGDRKAVTLNGDVGQRTFSNETYYCYIIGIDHNSGVEGSNRIHLQFGYTALSGGKHIAFVDISYSNNMSSGSWFNMNNSNKNSGGWNSSHMRTVICPAFKSAMSSDLQAVLKTTIKYSDNTGGGSDTASYVTATSEEVFLLAEYEVFGVRSKANSAEQNYQTQYAWYSAGNSKVRYRHTSTGSSAYWWLRSVYCETSNPFCRVHTSGSANYLNANFSAGFAPAFCV